MSATDHDPLGLADDDTPAPATPLQIGQRAPALTKSRFIAGLQCSKRAYLEAHHPELADPLDEAELATIEQGHDVGALARQAFPGGVTIPQDTLTHEQAVTMTRQLMADPTVPAIFEAAFLHDGLPVRVDCLARVGDPDQAQWELVEVKSSSEVKKEHVPDVAFQAHVLRAVGVQLAGTRVFHPDTAYARPAGDVDPASYFARADVAGEVADATPDVLAQIQSLKQVLAAPTPPTVPIGSHCKKPQTCPFYTHCHRERTEYPVHELPHLSQRAKSLLAAEGVADIREIPPDFTERATAHWLALNPGKKLPKDFAPLSENQCRIVEIVKTGVPHHDHAGLTQAFAQLQYPIHFTDFETVQPAIPMWAGTHAFDTIPVQWSNHTLHPTGRVVHKDFLHLDDSDPRPRFLGTLLKTLKGTGSILVYSSFEEKRLRELAALYPEHADAVEQVIGRFVDLLAILREHVYYPGFHGSHSLKSVLPVLVPTLSYKDLAIQNGAEAAAAFLEMLKPATPPERRAELSMQLLAYCRRDTEAMVALFLRLAPQFQARQVQAGNRRPVRAAGPRR